MSTAVSADVIAAGIVDLITTKLDLPVAVSPTSRFTELEIDSLILLELSVMLEQRFDVRLDEDVLSEAGSIDAVAGLVAAG